MNTPDRSIPKLSIQAGLLISAAFIAYFIFMDFFNLTHVIALRFLNVFILLSGLLITFRHYRTKTKILNIPYMEGLLLGISATMISVIFFAIFVYSYFSWINPAILLELKDHTVMMGSSLTALTAAATILIEGVCSGMIISFTIMQYYKSGFYRTLQEKRKDGVPV